MLFSWWIDFQCQQALHNESSHSPEFRLWGGHHRLKAVRTNSVRHGNLLRLRGEQLPAARWAASTRFRGIFHPLPKPENNNHIA